MIQPPPAGPPRQVDVRRAISAAYYALFHAVLIELADQFIGVTLKRDVDYGLAYRSISHSWARALCDETKKPSPGKKVAAYVPAGGFGPDIQAFSVAFLDLQEKRHNADYDPMSRVKTADARVAISTARSAIRSLKNAPAERRKRFLALLAFPPR